MKNPMPCPECGLGTIGSSLGQHSENCSRKSMDSLQFIEQIQKLDVRPGDLIVLRTSMQFSQDTYMNVKNALRHILQEAGFDNKVMILEEGMEIDVLRKVEGEAAS